MHCERFIHLDVEHPTPAWFAGGQDCGRNIARTRASRLADVLADGGGCVIAQRIKPSLAAGPAGATYGRDQAPH